MSQSQKLSSDTKNKLRVNEIQEFILDPKASIKKYLENNMSQTNPSEQSVHWDQPEGSPAGHLNASQQPQASGRAHSYSPYNPGPLTRPQQQEGKSGTTSHMASQVQPPSVVDYTSFTPPPALPVRYQLQDNAGYGITTASTPNVHLVGPAPPPAEPQVIVTLPAPRLYHRMITEYETIKAVFYSAKMQRTHNDLSPLASKLKALCRDIWNIRYTRASEFGYNEATTEERITEWKTQFEYWTDVLEDLLDARYVQKTELEAKENDWGTVAGLVTVTKKAAKANASVADAEAPVKKKVAKAATADVDAAPVEKKKKVKKVASAE
ncbi:hypothetical protein F5Y19DRAFT_485337 [Xylariaceae sp. FL1651]|nr:hypothetical protein F5Y19DRAFT_485337 [Xylariaceae sp. FL1651]